jgi:hypothetical protein
VPRRSAKTRIWLITIGATALSTYALDATATAAGALLAASTLMRGLDRTLLLVLLAASYALWAAGMRVNLQANGSLLEATGVSTSVVSKAAFELADRRGASARGRRAGAAAGYVVGELVKEVPYWAAAFGAATAIGGVSAQDALAFLCGTNLGAAIYEYGVGRATRAVLRATPSARRRRAASAPRRGSAAS